MQLEGVDLMEGSCYYLFLDISEVSTYVYADLAGHADKQYESYLSIV